MKTITLTKEFVTLVDDDMFQYLSQWRWYYSNGYAYRRINGKHFAMHHAILKTKGLVDHIDGNKLNNRKGNLRPATHSTNAMNMRKHTGASRYKGVSKQKNQWRVQIWKNNKRVFSESAPTERLAAYIYDLNAPIYFGDYARLNFEPVGKAAGELPE
jgi:hypothetical protein